MILMPTELRLLDFRIWGGATVGGFDIETLLPWIEWGYESIKS